MDAVYPKNVCTKCHCIFEMDVVFENIVCPYCGCVYDAPIAYLYQIAKDNAKRIDVLKAHIEELELRLFYKQINYSSI